MMFSPRYIKAIITDFFRIRKKVDGLRGVGVKNTEDAIVIGPPPDQRQLSILPGYPTVPFRILSAPTNFTDNNYQGAEIVAYDSSLSFPNCYVVGGPTITLMNQAEFPGTPNFPYGSGLLITSGSGQVNSGQCVIIKFPVKRVVEVRLMQDRNTGSLVGWFDRDNSAM